MKTNSARYQIKNVQMTVFSCLAILALSCASLHKQNSVAGPVAGKQWNTPLPDNTQFPMAWIPAGTFTMGSPDIEQGRKADESPQTTVTLTKGYWLGTTEVTVGQWKAVTGQSLRDKVLQLLNDETLYDFDGKKMKERDFMHFDKNNPDKIMANEDDG